MVVTDKAGKIVPGLELKDFTLLDNNQPSNILSFHAVDGTLTKADPSVEVILLVDTVNVGFQAVAQVRQELDKFLRENGGQLAEPVSLFWFTGDGVQARQVPSTDGNGLATQVDQMDSRLRTITRSEGAYGAIERLQLSIQWFTTIAQSEAKRPGRKLLIWMGGGWPTLDNPRFDISAKGQQQYFDKIVQLSTVLREARISVYSVSLGMPGVGTYLYQDFLKGVKTADKANAPNLGLKVLAIQSGGRVLGPDNGLAAQLDKCVEDAGAHYTLSFDPPRADRANEYHDLKVKVGQPGLTARTDTGYYNQP